MGTTNPSSLEQLLSAIQSYGYRVSAHAQEDGHWVASAKRGIEGKAHFSRGATEAAALSTLYRIIDKTDEETSDAAWVEFHMPAVPTLEPQMVPAAQPA